MRAGRAVLLAGAIGYALAAASTTPFTKPADILTGLAIVAFAVVVCVRWPLRTRSLLPVAPSPDSPSRPGHPFLPWVLLFVAFTVWELFNYLVHGTRADHPTFSSITDAMDRYYVLKALLFLGWLAGAWVIAQRGSPSAPPAQLRPPAPDSPHRPVEP
jgi:hypothetical protein